MNNIHKISADKGHKAKVNRMDEVKRIDDSLGSDETKMAKADRTDTSGFGKNTSMENALHVNKMDGAGQVNEISIKGMNENGLDDTIVCDQIKVDRADDDDNGEVNDSSTRKTTMMIMMMMMKSMMEMMKMMMNVMMEMMTVM